MVLMVLRHVLLQTGKHWLCKPYSTNSPLVKLSRTFSSAVKEHMNVGTIGHVDHGKTTLTSAITKVASGKGFAKFSSYEDIDRAEEERRRGITINATHVEYSTSKRHYAHTDCPGHVDFVKNMLTGASQMDAAILVIAATDGQMPQTREHLLLAKQAGVRDVIVYVNKADVVTPDLIELVELEARELLTTYGFDGENCQVVAGSALLAMKGERDQDMGAASIEKLLSALDALPSPPRLIDAPFLLPIESGLHAPNRGTVVLGTLKRGQLQKGATAELVGYGQRIKTSVSDLQVFHKSVDNVKAGEHFGALIRGGIRAETIQRGMVLAPRDPPMPMSDRLTARLYM